MIGEENQPTAAALDVDALWSRLVELVRRRAPNGLTEDFEAFLDRYGAKLRGELLAALQPPEQLPGPGALLPVADLCSGVGMLAFAFQMEGFYVTDLCEIDEDRQLTAWFNLTQAHTSVSTALEEAGRSLPARPADVHIQAGGGDARVWRPVGLGGVIAVLIGGPPCQPFSRLGDQKGEDDERDLFMDVAAICEETRPMVVVLENVEGTETEAHKDYFRRWWERMNAAGYDGVKWILRSADYGSPQLRMRAFFVAWRRGFPGAEVLKQPPTPTHYSAHWDPPPGLSPTLYAEILRRAQDAEQAWVGAMERANGGCCYGMWSCNWINNIDHQCEGCFRGSHYLESPHARDIAFPPGPKVRWFQDEAGTHYVEVSHANVAGELVQEMAAAVVPKKGARRTHKSISHTIEAYRKAPRVSWWMLTGDAPVLLEEGPTVVQSVQIAQVSREAMGLLLKARWPKALTGRALKLIPERTVARRRLQFRRQPKQLRYAKVLDRAQRMTGRHKSFLTPALLARSYAAMGGTIYATTNDGEDGIESLRGASVLEHMTAMGLPSWFAPGVTEAPKGDIFAAMGNGVPVELGRAVARHVWAAFGREVLGEPIGAGLWATGEEPGVEPGRADYTWCETAQHVHDEIGGAGWNTDRWFEVGQEMEYGEQDDEDEDEEDDW